MRRKKSSSVHIWPAFSDLLSGLLLTFLVIFLHQTNIIESTGVINVEECAQNKKDLAECKTMYKYLLEEYTKLKKDMIEMNKSLGASKEMAETVESALKSQGIKANLNAQNGSIEIDESVLFKASEFTISSTTDKEALRKIGVALQHLLEDQEKSKLISAIMVIGHADQTGDWLYNQDISTRRANALVQMWNQSILKQRDNVEGCIVPKLIAAGVGESRPLVDTTTMSSNNERHEKCGHYLTNIQGEPILNEQGQKSYLPENGCKKNRRIEIMIVPKPPTSKVVQNCP